MRPYHIDYCTTRFISGWVLPTQGMPAIVSISRGGGIARVEASLSRPDVAEAYPNVEGAANCGFVIELANMTPGLAEIAVLADQELLEVVSILVDGACTPAFPEPRFAASLPVDVMHRLHVLWPTDDLTFATTAVHRMTQVAKARDVHFAPEIIRYLRYLRQISSHFDFVMCKFPASNPDRTPKDKDFNTRANSAAEMLMLANHLYVLRSYGVFGEFAEFGCFKGFSTAMLSYACGLLGVRMHVFDSFEGLPRSNAKEYQAGDFAGSLVEVEANVELFGNSEIVAFHKGFFSASLRAMKAKPKLMSMWMDVDLESSAIDALSIFPLVDPRGAVFSHECGPTSFKNGEVTAARAPNCVIPPILDAFSQSGR